MFMKMVRLSSLLATFVLVTFAICFEFPAHAGSVVQNSNSSTTTVENANAAAPSAKKGRRSRKATAATKAATPVAGADSAAMPEAQDATSQQPTAATTQTDLSGTYAGTFDCGDAGVNGETTLTITGNQFTTADGKSGRITAATTQGYTGVAMQFGESAAATATTPASVPTIVSMRAKKAGDRLTLMAVPGSGKVCSFTPAGSSRVTRARKVRAATPAQPAVPAATGEPVTAPAAAPPASAPPAAAPVPPAAATEPVTPGAEAGPAPPAAPSPGRRAKKKPGGTPN